MSQGLEDGDHSFMNLGLGLDVDGCDHQCHSLSRLSICTADPTSMAMRPMPMEMHMEKLSMEYCSDGGGGGVDDDDEDYVSDGGVGEKDKAAAGNCRGVVPDPGLLFQGDHHSSSPATPTGTPRLLKDYFCYYASDDDAPRRGHRRASRGGGGERREVSNPSDPRWVKRAIIFRGKTAAGDSGEDDGDGSGGDCGEGGELNQPMMITRAKGGRRPLWMDLEEVKACKDLGFELEMPATPSPPGTAIPAADSTPSCAGGWVDTSSTDSASSPIASWRISSPGDDPRDVKARLKVWAQAVALASASSSSSVQSN